MFPVCILYCDVTTWSVAWLRLSKHVSAAMDTRATIEEIVRCGVFYAVRDEVI